MMSDSYNLNQPGRPAISIVGASAGTGKTTRLAAEFLEAVQGTTGNPPLDPTRIIVCTFTNKAADELSARIRQKLLQSGRTDAAQLVLGGYVGTVNSICGRLLRDYAFECELSPEQEVIPEETAANLFAIASADVIDAYAQHLEGIARRLSFTDNLRKSKFQKRSSWVDHVRKLCTLARANRMEPAVLRESAKNSWQEMKVYLEEPYDIPAEQLDELLLSELERTINAIEAGNDRTDATTKALQTLREVFAHARTDGMTWRDWASLKKINPGVKTIKTVECLMRACMFVHRHPRLHADLEQYLSGIFDCAAECLEAYQLYKRAHGLVDFVDQEYLALDLLDNPAVRQSLSSRLDLVLIDEFQDTSPIQLALFLKLAELSARSIWVGDVKQAIYGFRGTDPLLMQEAAAIFDRLPQLEASYRSRPELVSFCNEVFRRVFPNFGISEDSVVIQHKRERSQKHTIELWRCEGAELKTGVAALAEGVRDFLSEGNTVIDPETRLERPARGSDLAVLCRKNEHCARLAEALAQAGLKVAMIRDGLLETPECLLTVATLRYLVDSTDKVALGHIVHLTNDYDSSNQSAWLSKWLAQGYHPERLLKNAKTLAQARASLPECTINDALNLSIDAGGVFEAVLSWGDAPERLSNLDALRGLVVDYEVTCSIARRPTTIAGFLQYLLQLEESDQPASTDVDAVQVLTYHGAKGLEWPVVILSDLDSESSTKVHKDLCKAHVESTAGDFDVGDPLKGRWIRFWPWPFGAIEKDGHFEENARKSPEFNSTHARVSAENVRLMYVGMTRARDMLVLAPYTGRSKFEQEGIQWLDELVCNGEPVLKFPEDPGPGTLRIGDSEHQISIRDYLGAASLKLGPDPARKTFAPGVKEIKPLAGPRPSYHLRPSSLIAAPDESDGEEADDIPGGLPADAVINIGERISIHGKADMALLGDCVHSFLAVDDERSDRNERLAAAQNILRLWRVEQITGEDLLVMSDRLFKFLHDRFPGFKKFTECPVTARVGLQRLKGAIDLLIETGDAFHIIDHKAFPGTPDKWVAKALSFAPQLNAYREAIEMAAGKPVNSLLIHMPIVGKVIDLTDVTLRRQPAGFS